MELIDIIFKVLIFGGALLLIVILASYLASRIRRIENPQIDAIRQSEPLYAQNRLISQEQIGFRKNSQNSYPIIFYVDQQKNRDIKIVKKQTFHGRENQENLRPGQINIARKTQSNNKRYTIINEELNKDRKFFVVNYYQ